MFGQASSSGAEKGTSSAVFVARIPQQDRKRDIIDDKNEIIICSERGSFAS